MISRLNPKPPYESFRLPQRQSSHRESTIHDDIAPYPAPLPTVVVHSDKEDSFPGDRAVIPSPPPAKNSSATSIGDGTVVVQATSRNTAPQLGNLLSLHRRAPRQDDDESLVASDGSEDDDKLSQLPEDPLLDNVVAPEYDRQRVERQRKMEERHKFYMIIGPAVVMSIQMFVMGVALIVLPFCYPNGWRLQGYLSEENILSHYLWGPHLHVLIYILFVTTLQKEDRDARKHQPLIDLMKGNANAARSLLLNYDNENVFSALYKSISNRHWHVTLGVTSGLLAAAFGPLSSSIFSMQPRWSVDAKNMTSVLEIPELNISPNVLDLTSFLNAANYGVVNVTFGIGDPQWVYQGYTIGEFELPANVSNGTVRAETIAIRHEPHCARYDTGTEHITSLANNSGWTNTVSFKGCKLEWSVKNTAKDSYGVLTPLDDSACLPQSRPLHHRPVIFWFFTQIPHPTLDAIACTPTISLWNVTADVDLYTKKLTQVQPIEVLMLPSTSEFPRASSTSISTNRNQHINSTGNSILDRSLSNISGYPMYGLAHNGLFFDWNTTDSLVLERLQGLQMVLPATMYRAAKLGPGGLEGAFRDGFEGYAERVYGMYLSIMARSLYFVPSSSLSTNSSSSSLSTNSSTSTPTSTQIQIPTQISTTHPRLLIRPTLSLPLGTLLILTSLLSLLLSLLSHQPRTQLAIGAPLGTLASYLSLGMDGPLMEYLVNNRGLPGEEWEDKLGGMRFGFGWYVNGTRRVVVQRDRVKEDFGDGKENTKMSWIARMSRWFRKVCMTLGCSCMRGRKPDNSRSTSSLPQTESQPQAQVQTSHNHDTHHHNSKKTDDPQQDDSKDKPKKGKAREIIIDIERGDPAMEALQLKAEDRPCWGCLAGKCPDCNPPSVLRSGEEGVSSGSASDLGLGSSTMTSAATLATLIADSGSGQGDDGHISFSHADMDADASSDSLMEDEKVERWLRGLPGRGCPCKDLIEKMASRSQVAMARNLDSSANLLKTKTSSHSASEQTEVPDVDIVPAPVSAKVAAIASPTSS